jgi:hypothetical protein
LLLDDRPGALECNQHDSPRRSDDAGDNNTREACDMGYRALMPCSLIALVFATASITSKAQHPIYEYACHEGNELSMVGMLRGARAQEKF